MARTTIAKTDVAQLSSNLGRYFHLTRTSLVIDGEPPLSVWKEAGKSLGKIQGAVQWWIGDWLNYGEKKYREMYAQALKETEMKYGTLADLKYVASRIESSRRRENLTWAHHREVAPMESDEQDKWLDLAEKGNSDGKPWKVKDLRRAIKESKPSEFPPWLYYTDIWRIPDCDERFGKDYSGRIPGQIIQNLLYYFGKLNDLVVDPMAGGGVTVDVCKSMKRKCIAFDISPSRDGIIKHDARNKPWPFKELANLIFIDPPYWSQLETHYEGIAQSKTYEEFISDMSLIIDAAHSHLIGGGILAILIAPMAIKEAYKETPLDLLRAACERGFNIIRRIAIPVSSQQVGPQVMEACKKNKIMLALLRDLLVLEKK